MKAKQAIDLLENGIMPCVLISSTGSNKNSASTQKTMLDGNPSLVINNYGIDYICKYSLSSSSSPYRGSSNFPPYRFITLNGKYLFANNLDEEISINNNNSGGGEVEE